MHGIGFVVCHRVNAVCAYVVEKLGILGRDAGESLQL
jgi:hypothetical protein